MQSRNCIITQSDALLTLSCTYTIYRAVAEGDLSDLRPALAVSLACGLGFCKLHCICAGLLTCPSKHSHLDNLATHLPCRVSICAKTDQMLTGGIPCYLLILQEVFPSLLIIFLVLNKLYSFRFTLRATAVRALHDYMPSSSQNRGGQRRTASSRASRGPIDSPLDALSILRASKLCPFRKSNLPAGGVCRTGNDLCI